MCDAGWMGLNCSQGEGKSGCHTDLYYQIKLCTCETFTFVTVSSGDFNYFKLICSSELCLYFSQYVQQVSMAMAVIKHARAQTEAHVILFTDGAPVLLVSMEIPASKVCSLISTVFGIY